MHSLKSIKLYFFSILKLSLLSFRNYYLSSSFYNKKLISFIPDRFFYSPSAHLCASLITTNSDFYKITNQSTDLFWDTDIKDIQKFENLHGFLWLTKLDRKNSKIITKDIINSWIDSFSNFTPKIWDMEIMARRIISWVSNTDITLDDSDRIYKKKFYISLVKQGNFILKNLKNISYNPDRITCCAAIILYGIVFENNLSFKTGVKELEKISKSFFDENGFPKSRNPEEVFICIKYLILVREWLKESQNHIPDFLNEIISKCGNCYAILSSSNNQFPLFNGATEINYRDYDIFLKNLKYKFVNKNNEISNFIKIKKKKIEFFMDCGNPPSNSYVKNYQAGCLAFELISNKQKIICNTGYGKYLPPKLSLLSRSTAAHSTLYINNTSSCVFQKNKFINKIYGNSLIEKHKVISKNYMEDKNFYSISASQNGYEKRFGYIHTRSIKISKNDDKILGKDELKKTKNCSKFLVYFIRFHIYPNTRIVKTKAGNSILISLSNGEGWLMQCKQNNFEIEKNIFLGNKNKIINNESVFISGDINKDIILIEWDIERVS